MVEQLIARWGVLGIVLGTFLEGETVLVLGGALANKGLLQFHRVVLAAFAGSLLGDQLWFLLGRRFGARLLARRPKWRARVDRVSVSIGRWGDVFAVGFRFAWGFRTVTPIVLANSGYPWRRFAVLNAIGAALWALAIGWLGWAAGATFQKVAGRVVRWEELGFGVAALVLGLVLLRRYLGSRRARRVAVATARHDP